jgi:NAD(P)-dependent dehydrogenase (short-subunit alcohol dehydrogenase family)
VTRFRGKTAVVTGGASGIGESIVRLLVEEEAAVVIADLQQELGHALADDLGDAVRFVSTDVANETDVAAAVGRAVDEFGRLDVMCNNAGIVGPDPSIVDVTIDDYQRTLGVLVLGVILGTKHSARAMIRQGRGGAIVNTASIASVRGGLGPHLYTTAKHAVVGLTRSTASELVSHDIRVNCVAPGGIATPMGAQHVFGDAGRVDELAASIASRSPLSRGSTPTDIAEAVAFLASDAAGYICGQTLVVDAGRTIAPPRTPGEVGNRASP